MKTERIEIRCTKADLADLTRAAKADSLSRSSWVLVAALEKARGTVIVSREPAELIE